MAERKKLDPDFKAQCELMAEEAKERQKAEGKQWGRGRPKNLPELIPEGF